MKQEIIELAPQCQMCARQSLNLIICRRIFAYFIEIKCAKEDSHRKLLNKGL